MPRVDIRAGVWARDLDVVLIECLASEMPGDEHNADLGAERTGARSSAEPQGQPSGVDNGGRVRPLRLARCAARCMSDRARARARGRQDDSETHVIDLLAQRSGSTAGDIAKGLNLDPQTCQPI
jgi:hypothetical protein